MGRKDIHWAWAEEGQSTLAACEVENGKLFLLIISVASARGDPAGAALGAAGAPCSLHQAIKGVEAKVPISLSARLERVIVWPSSGVAASGGAGLKSL